MKKSSAYRAAAMAVFLPLALLLFISCSSTPEKVLLTGETAEHWNATVDKAIAEPERAANLKSLGSQLIEVANSIQQDVEAFNEKAMALNEDYDAHHVALQHLFDDFSKQRNPKFTDYRDIVFAMRSQVSADEWKTLID